MRKTAFFVAVLLALIAGPPPAAADTTSAAATAKQASAAIDAGQYPRAIDLATAAITADSNYSWAYYLRAFAYRQLGKYGEATKDLDESERIDATFSSVPLERGRIALAQERYADAEQAFSKALTLATSDSVRSQAYQGRADAKSDQGDDRGAIADGKAALEYAPGDASIMSDLANYAFGLNDFAQSKMWLYRAVIAAPKNAWEYDHLGIFFYWRHDYAASVENFNKALALTPRSWPTLNRRAIAYTAQEKYDAALRDARAAFTRGNLAEALATEALACWSSGKLVQAQQLLTAAIARKSSAAYYDRALLELSQNQDHQAAADLERDLRENHGKDAYDVSFLSVAYSRIGEENRRVKLLSSNASWTSAPAWPTPVRAYLQGTIPADALFAEATTTQRLIAAKTLVALDLLVHHRDRGQAKSYLRWVRSNAIPGSPEYGLSKTLLEVLN